MTQNVAGPGVIGPVPGAHEEEEAGLIAHAQDNPSSRAPFDPYERDVEHQSYESDLGYREAAGQFTYEDQPVGNAYAADDYYEVPREHANPAQPAGNPTGYRAPSSVYEQPLVQEPDETQQAVGGALWGTNPHQHPNGPAI